MTTTRSSLSSPGKYRTICVDPPWPIRDSGPRTPSAKGNWDASGMVGKNSVVPYDRMSIDEIAALPVRSMAEKGAHLYLWTINAYIEDTYEIARLWGFRPSALLTWCKEPMGIGFGGTYCNTTEHVLFARRGVCAASMRIDTTWFRWARGPHSAKPEAFLDMVETVSPAPRLEMFARRQRLGWDTWGNEALEHVSLAEGPAA